MIFSGLISTDPVCCSSVTFFLRSSQIILIGYVRDGLSEKTNMLMVPTWDWSTIRAYRTKWVEYAVDEG